MGKCGTITDHILDEKKTASPTRKWANQGDQGNGTNKCSELRDSQRACDENEVDPLEDKAHAITREEP
jgi:hypothetical protein